MEDDFLADNFLIQTCFELEHFQNHVFVSPCDVAETADAAVAAKAALLSPWWGWRDDVGHAAGGRGRAQPGRVAMLRTGTHDRIGVARWSALVDGGLRKFPAAPKWEYRASISAPGWRCS
jgi:hypothetical protein